MIVLSLGGSLIVNERGINVAYLRRFVALMKREVKKGKRFLIVCGGGETARRYHRAAARLNRRTRAIDYHWVGMRACVLNAELLKAALRELAPPELLTREGQRRMRISAPVGIGGGGVPGISSDGGAVRWARRLGARTVYNLTNVDGVYSRDPRVYKNAKFFPRLTWKQYLRVLGMKTWVANAHAPFDPLASRMAARWGISAVILDGADLANFSHALAGKSFRGTILSGA